MRQARDEPWKARASEHKESVQAQTNGMTAPGDWEVADKAKAHCPRLEGFAPWPLSNQNCLDSYELLNISALVSRRL
jgi:hypothetical protein